MGRRMGDQRRSSGRSRGVAIGVAIWAVVLFAVMGTGLWLIGRAGRRAGGG